VGLQRAAWSELLGNHEPGELMSEWVRGIPMARAGTGDDVAGLVTFLASEDASYTTGQTINVDVASSCRNADANLAEERQESPGGFHWTPRRCGAPTRKSFRVWTYEVLDLSDGAPPLH
jgi:hypothetical protein